MKFIFETSPMVCSQEIALEIDEKNQKIRHVAFLGGCPGSLTAISKLVEGMNVDAAIRTLKGTVCADKATSCPDQLAIALQMYLDKQK